jgi:hypothetical protein
MFTVDESTLETGVLALSTLALMVLADAETG